MNEISFEVKCVCSIFLHDFEKKVATASICLCEIHISHAHSIKVFFCCKLHKIKGSAIFLFFVQENCGLGLELIMWNMVWPGNKACNIGNTSHTPWWWGDIRRTIWWYVHQRAVPRSATCAALKRLINWFYMTYTGK